MKTRFIFSLFLLVLLLGCAHAPEQSTASITFKRAMMQLAEGLNEFKEQSKKEEGVFGLAPSTVEATFNIGITKKRQDKTAISIDPTSVLKGFTSLTSSLQYEGSENRGNTITIKFRNILFAKPGEAVYDKGGAAVVKTLKELKNGGMTMESTPNKKK